MLQLDTATMSGTEVWLYGSSARGDNDASSDVDVLVAGELDVDIDKLCFSTDASISITRYSWRELEQMAGYGSLFLHHVRLEGRPLVETGDKRLETLLGSLGRYTRAHQELRCFSQVLGDVEQSLDGDHSVAFELSVVATAARHAAILGCYLLSQPDFGRTSAFRRLLPQIGYDSDFVESVEQLYAFRQAENAGRPSNQAATSGDVRVWISKIRELIVRVEQLVA